MHAQIHSGKKHARAIELDALLVGVPAVEHCHDVVVPVQQNDGTLSQAKEESVDELWHLGQIKVQHYHSHWIVVAR